jgi:hypothetical protein
MNQVECTRCGNCCPDTCPEKIVESETGLATCAIHPSITGKPRDVWGCAFTPERYFLCGIACQAVLMDLQNQHPNLTYQPKVLPNGQVIIEHGTLLFNDPVQPEDKYFDTIDKTGT